jgi:YVTN family beta-propeller protein
MYFKLMLLATILLTGNLSPAVSQNQGPASEAAAKGSSGTPQTYTHEGISIEFSIDPIRSTKDNSSQLLAGTEATVRFKIYDAGRANLSNLRPAVWIDRRSAEQATGARECREKIQSFLQPSFSKRPDIDLNAYFILALNHEPNISVIDPLFGFGGSKLYALIALPGTGEDWVMSSDKKRLYVSVPGVNQVAVIDTVQWKVIAKIEAGVEPSRIALQHDGKYLWIGNNNADDRQSGVTVIDTDTLKVAAQLTVGAGPHELALTEDDRFVFVTNKQAGTLSVIDVSKLSRISDIKIGDRPAALAFSNLSKAVYVASEGDGTITAVDTVRLEIIARMKAEPGLRVIRIPRDSRFGFAVNPATNKFYIFDSAANRIQHSVLVGPGADQIAFTKEFAYVRAPGNEFVTMIRISDLDKNEVAVNRFPAGQKAPKDSPASSLADAIISAPGNGSVLVANPADKMIYYYTEGMAAPMGSFQNYRRDPKALLVLAHGLAESSGGAYSTTVRLPNAGRYDVAFLLDSPRLVNCFPVVIAENPALPKPKRAAIKIEPLSTSATARVGRAYNLRFKVIDSGSGQLKPNLEDLGVLVFLAPGIWQERQWAKSIGGGIYEVSFVPPDSGVYYVYFQSPSLGLKLSELTPIILRAN